jgi:O-methyltransferase domain
MTVICLQLIHIYFSDRIDYFSFQWILHDWSDEDCIKILQRCKKAIPPRDVGGKVIIVDIVVGSAEKAHWESQLLFDMLMMTLTTGRERDEKEWWNLFKQAGFSSYKINATLGVRSIIEVYP